MAAEAAWLKERWANSLFGRPLTWPFGQNGGRYLHVIFYYGANEKTANF